MNRFSPVEHSHWPAEDNISDPRERTFGPASSGILLFVREESMVFKTLLPLHMKSVSRVHFNKNRLGMIENTFRSLQHLVFKAVHVDLDVRGLRHHEFVDQRIERETD